MEFKELLNKKKRPLILDGAMGSLLESEGILNKDLLWSANALIDHPEQVFNIHQQYLRAGADIITTNTFRTNPFVFDLSNLSNFDFYVDKAVSICKSAAIDFSDVIIAGSNPPAEDCYQKERTINNNALFDNHIQHIERLIFNDVDIIWNATFSHLDEIIFVCKYCSLNNYPFVINIFLNNNLRILSGENIDLVVDIIKDFNPVAIGFNCISSDTFSKINANVFTKHKYGYYFNCGSEIHDEIIHCEIRENDYKDIVKKNITSNLVFVGSCCCSSPAHTKAIKEAFDEIYKS